MMWFHRFMVFALLALALACVGIDQKPLGDSERFVAPPGAFSRPPTLAPAPPGAFTAAAPTGLRVVGAASLGPDHARFRSPVFTQVPMSVSLSPGTPVVALDQDDTGAWVPATWREAPDDERRLGPPPLIGWVNSDGRTATVPYMGFSTHAVGAPAQPERILVTPIGTTSGPVDHVCVANLSFAVWEGPLASGYVTGQSYRGDAFREELFKKLFVDMVNYSVDTDEENAIADSIVNALDAINSNAQSGIDVARRGRWSMGALRFAFGVWRAALHGTNPRNIKFITFKATENFFNVFLTRLDRVNDAVRFSRDTWREATRSSLAAGVMITRMERLGAILETTQLYRDPAVQRGWERARQDILRRYETMLGDNISRWVEAGIDAFATGREVTLGALIARGLKLVAEVFGKAAGVSAILLADLAEGAWNETEHRASLCALATTLLYLDDVQERVPAVSRPDHREFVLIAKDLLAVGARANIQGERSSLSTRLIGAGLTYASDTIRRGQETQVAFYTSMHEQVRRELLSLYASRLDNDRDDAPDVTPTQMEDRCRVATAPCACMAAGAECGWCEETRTCMSGNDIGPYRGACTARWAAASVACGTVNPGPAPVTAPSDPCRAAATCGQCLARVGCGFCRLDSSCRTGAAAGVPGCVGVNWIAAGQGSLCPPVAAPPRAPCPCPVTGTHCATTIAQMSVDRGCFVDPSLLVNPNAVLYCDASGFRASNLTCLACAAVPGIPARCTR